MIAHGYMHQWLTRQLHVNTSQEKCIVLLFQEVQYLLPSSPLPFPYLGLNLGKVVVLPPTHTQIRLSYEIPKDILVDKPSIQEVILVHLFWLLLRPSSTIPTPLYKEQG